MNPQTAIGLFMLALVVLIVIRLIANLFRPQLPPIRTKIVRNWTKESTH